MSLIYLAITLIVVGVLLWAVNNYIPMDGKIKMSKTNGPLDRIKTGLGIALLAAVMGCAAYVGGGYGDAVVVPEPDVYFWGGGYVGGGYERGRDVHAYSHRGSESRAVAHSRGSGDRGGKR